MKNEKNLILIFTRNLQLGKVKTRLAKSIGNQNALAVYKLLLEHTRDEVIALDATKRVGYSNYLGNNDLWNEDHFEKFVQEGEDLGARIKHAFAKAFSEQFEKVIIIGSDLYDLQTQHLEEALCSLDTYDAVIGPALDGGYYLFGMKTLLPGVFENKNWGTATVLRDTRKDLDNYKVRFLEPLNDIDLVEDLEAYPEFAEYISSVEKQFANQ